MKIRIYHILKNTKTEGPGTRYCIWFQGCRRHCKGCWAVETWDLKGGKEYNVIDILNDIFSTPDIEGVTFLGGEPFEQPEALMFLARNIKQKGLSIVCFTGYKIEYLKKKI